MTQELTHKNAYNCATCGRDFVPSYARTGEPKYCSQRCYHTRPVKNTRRIQRAKCHPDKPHSARGLCANCYSKQHRLENGSRYREASYRHNLKKNYGITGEEFDLMLAQQGHCCANEGCRANLDRTGANGKKPHVDHCHATGSVRGILCHNCNVALGVCADSADRLNGLAAYLRDTQVGGLWRAA